jgi:co-chaperonin GroES (HSP10)
MNETLGREVILVGDKVLIKPEEESARTPTGLYLPQSVQEREQVGGGYVVNVGPGYPLVETGSDREPWSRSGPELRYVQLQARPGDYALYLRREAVEIELDGKRYVIVAHGSILLLIRDRLPLP